jgi:phycoerythrin-associated linker protein
MQHSRNCEMDILQFVAQSLGCWRSQRSAHHLAFAHFEAVRSTINITALDLANPTVTQLCKLYDVSPELAVSPFQMSWEGESDWDNNGEIVQGSCTLVPVPDPIHPHQGRLLRDQGYAEEIAAAGNYHFTEDGVFVLVTAYERAAAEEKIWFVNPNFRLRVSLIKTSAGSGVVTASFSSEIRQLVN